MASVAILVDVDGVLSPFPGPDSCRDHWPASDWKHDDVGGTLGIEWSSGVIERLRTLTDLPGVTAWWCTTWRSHAPRVLAPMIGLGADWDVCDVEGGAFAEGGWWKSCCARDAVGMYDAVVWIDDMLDAWQAEMALSGGDGPEEWPGGRLLMVSPASDLGLEAHHLDQIEAFVRDALAD